MQCARGRSTTPSSRRRSSASGGALSFPDPLGGIGNFCGLPAISVPSGFTPKKLPAGIQFVGRARDDAKVVAAAELFQQHSDWHRKRPPV